MPRLEWRVTELNEKKGYPPAELKFLTDACTEAMRCSSMLKWSYAYGYYCVDGAKNPGKKNLYEYNQEDLEKYNQGLFGMIESDFSQFTDETKIDKKPFYMFKDKCVSLTEAVKQYYQKLAEHI